MYSLRATNEFVYDDFPLIKFQPRPRTLDAVLDAASQTHWNHLPYYRPLSRLLLAAERMAFGDEPTAYHLFNAVLAGLVAVLARALFSHPDLRVAPALATVAAITALAAVVTVHRGRYYATNPAPYHALASLGEEAHYAMRWAEAERYYRAAVAVDPVAASFVYEPLGLTLEAQAKTAEAIAEYRAALVEDPNYAYAHTNLALLLEGTGARDEAIAHLQAALRVQPGLAPARTALDRLQPR